jgi:type IV secretory pathway component VirB8
MNNQNQQNENQMTLEQKIDKIYLSVEKTRKYIWWAFVVTVLAVVLPLIGLLFAIPNFLAQFNQIKSMGL